MTTTTMSSSSDEQQTMEEQNASIKAQRVKRIFGLVAIVAVVAVILIGLSVLIIEFAVTGTSRCELSKSRPKFRYPQDLQIVASADFKTLVKTSAYLELNRTQFKNDKSYFIELKGSLTASVEQLLGNKTKLKLSNGCIDISIATYWQARSAIMQEIEVNVNPSSGANVICTTDQRGEIWFPIDKHYWCKRKLNLSCLDNENHEFELTFESLEFEQDGNPDYIERGLFSKRPYQCNL